MVGALAACGPAEPQSSDTPSNTTATGQARSTRPAQSAATPLPAGSAPPVASGHNAGAPPKSAPVAEQPTGIDTAALDAKIAQAEAKAKVSGASDADRTVAAASYIERGNVYYEAGQPRLYKFALRDFRRALRYQPDNVEAREKMEMIVAIYQSLNRPVPDLGNEP